MGGTRFFYQNNFLQYSKAMNPRTGNQQLWFLCSAFLLIVVNISVKFVKISQTVFKVLSGNDFMTNKTLFHLNEHVISHPLGKSWKLIPHFLMGFKNVALQGLFINLSETAMRRGASWAYTNSKAADQPANLIRDFSIYLYM